MLWIKAFHLIFVTASFSALFYLPRIFVNLAQVDPASVAERERLLQMAWRLFRFGAGLFVIALALGVWLWQGFGVGSGQAWMHAKLTLVVLVIGYGHACWRLLRRFEQNNNRRSHRWYRLFNEVGVLLFAAIVILVIVKPWA